MRWTYAEYFLGIGAPGKAIQRVTARHGDECEFVYGFEIDKYARNSFAAIHDVDESLIYHDITDQPDELPEVDIVFYSPPCQTFSLAGKREGTSVDKGNLFYNALEGIKKSNPKFCIMENVANLANQFVDDFKDMMLALEQAGYTSYNKVLNSKHYGIPQNRERIFVVGIRNDIYEQGHRFEWPLEIKLKKRLKDVLEDDVDKKYYLSDEIVNRFAFVNGDDSIVGTTAPPQRSIGQRDVVYGTHSCIGALMASDYKQPKQILVKSATSSGYEEATEGDSINLEHPNSKTRRGRVGKGVSQTLTTSCNQAVLEPVIAASRGRDKDNPSDRTAGNPNRAQRLEVNQEGISNSLTTVQKDNYVLNPGVSIRKLTPLECFRLQGFDDEDYHKAVAAYDKRWKAGSSDSQMYKRAGNSITVNVEEELLEQLLYQRKQVNAQLSLF